MHIGDIPPELFRQVPTDVMRLQAKWERALAVYELRRGPERLLFREIAARIKVSPSRAQEIFAWIERLLRKYPNRETPLDRWVQEYRNNEAAG